MLALDEKTTRTKEHSVDPTQPALSPLRGALVRALTGVGAVLLANMTLHFIVVSVFDTTLLVARSPTSRVLVPITLARTVGWSLSWCAAAWLGWLTVARARPSHAPWITASIASAACGALVALMDLELATTIFLFVTGGIASAWVLRLGGYRAGTPSD